MLPAKLIVVDDSPTLEVTSKSVQLIKEDDQSVLKVQDSVRQLKVEQKEIIVLSKGFQGPRGPQGEIGPTGEQGEIGPQGIPGSGGDKSYVHVQLVPSDVWEIPHNLNKFPTVSVVDSADSWVIGDTRHDDENTTIIEFSAAFAGKAYLN